MPGGDEKNVVSFRVESHGPGARLRLNIVYDVKFIRRILVNNGKSCGPAGRGKRVGCIRVEQTGIGARTDAWGGNHVALICIHHYQFLVIADRKQTAILLIHRFMFFFPRRNGPDRRDTLIHGVRFLNAGG